MVVVEPAVLAVLVVVMRHLQHRALLRDRT
jgi:hypothetical protein